MTEDHAPPTAAARRRTLILVVLGLAAAALLAWWLVGRAKDGGGEGRGRGAATTVGIAKVERADVPVALTAIGTVQPTVAATVRTQLSGTIFSLDFQEGQAVSKGQRIAQIDPRPFRLALAQAEGALARDQAQLNSARTDLGRYRTLLAQDSIARQQVEQQEALVGQYQGTIEQDRAAVGVARLNLDYTAIKAPVSGRVGLRQVDIGNYVTPGDANGIVVITQSDPIDVSFALPQDQLPRVQARVAQGGTLPVQALDQAGTGVLGAGRFLTFDNQVDAATGTVRAKARFPNGAGRLFPNQFVNVSILVETLQGALTVPVTAVRNGAGGDFVFLLQPNRTVRLRRVKTGPQANGRVVVSEGLKLGDTVITEGADKLDDGAEVSLPGDKPKERGADGKRAGATRSGGGGAR